MVRGTGVAPTSLAEPALVLFARLCYLSCLHFTVALAFLQVCHRLRRSSVIAELFCLVAGGIAGL